MVLSEASVMKEVNDGLDLLYEWSGNQKMRLELIYRGPRDGTSVLDVNKRRAGKSPTFTFIKSEHGLVFGLFTSIPWAVPAPGIYGAYSGDNTAYIFSLSKKTKHPQFSRKENALRHYNADFVLVAGNSGDISIKEHFDLRSNNETNFGSGYGTF